MSGFELSITPADSDIDELGHVNNAVWVRWLQDVATAHWLAAADPAHVDAYIWVVVRHEVDYLGNVKAGETVTARTWVGDAPRGARFDRHVEFTGPEGKVKVRAKTTWAIVDRATGRILRVPKEVAARFLPDRPFCEEEGPEGLATRQEEKVGSRVRGNDEKD